MDIPLLPWERAMDGMTTVIPEEVLYPNGQQFTYMPFPSERVSRIPSAPAERLRHSKKPFLEWIQTGLKTASYDIDTLKLHALIKYKADGLLVSHPTAPEMRFPCSEKYDNIGNLELEATIPSGVTPNPDTIARIDQIVKDTKTDANTLLRTLMDCTHALYGTQTPHRGWPALLRAAARGWAVTMIKARLGSLYKNEFDFDGNMDDTKPDYLFRVVHTNEEFKLKSHANCSARITNLLVRMIIDLKVPIFENEDGNFERLNGPMHLGLPNSTDDQNFAERLYYWTTETDNLVKSLFPLDYCVRLMFKPVFPLANPPVVEHTYPADEYPNGYPYLRLPGNHEEGE